MNPKSYQRSTKAPVFPAVANSPSSSMLPPAAAQEYRLYGPTDQQQEIRIVTVYITEPNLLLHPYMGPTLNFIQGVGFGESNSLSLPSSHQCASSQHSASASFIEVNVPVLAERPPEFFVGTTLTECGAFARLATYYEALQYEIEIRALPGLGPLDIANLAGNSSFAGSGYSAQVRERDRGGPYLKSICISGKFSTFLRSKHVDIA